MEQYKISRKGIGQLKKSILTKVLPFMLLAVSGGLAMAMYNKSAHGQTNTGTLLLTIPMLVILLAIVLFRTFTMQKKLLESYVLTISPDSITREQHNTPTISIPLPDITEIIKYPDGNIIIKGRSSYDVIGIFAHTEGYEVLENRLAAIMPVTHKAHLPFFHRFRGLLIIGMIVLMAGVFVAGNKIIVSICGAILLVFMGYFFAVSQKDRNLDEKTKKASWWALLVMASIIGVMYFKLIGKA